MNIGNIIDQFNFEHVHAYMLLTKHTWVMGNELKVPDISDLVYTATMLLNKAYNSDKQTVEFSTGGFRAYKHTWGLELTFSIETKYATNK